MTPLTIHQAADLLNISPKVIRHWLHKYGLFRAEAPVAPEPWRFGRRQLLILAAIADLVEHLHIAASDAVEALRDAPADELADEAELYWARIEGSWGRVGDGCSRPQLPSSVEVDFGALWHTLEEKMG